MASRPESAGSIYDLGYRRYEGPRLGRGHAITALYVQSLRAAFGLGRGASSKVVPIALLIIALVPATIHLGIAAATSSSMDIVQPENYFAFIEIVLALFVAAVATELVGRDQRNHTLPLYFSRALKRSDYALAKLAALASAMLVLTLLPETVLFVGNAFTTNASWEYLRDNVAAIPRIAASALVVSSLCAAVALAIAAQTPRRAYATGGTIALFVVSSTAGGIVAVTLGRYGALLSLLDIMRGATLWVFGADQEFDVAGELMFGASVGVTVAATVLVFLRYRRVAA